MNTTSQSQTTRIDPSPINNQSPKSIINNQPTPSRTHNLNTWNIITHNAQGFNNRAKQQLWHTYCLQQNIDIALIMETQVQTQQSQYWRFLTYKTWWNNNTKGAGITLMIKEPIAKHIG